MITITEKEKEKRFSIEITIKDILNVLDEAKKRKIVKFGTNDVCKNLSKYNYFGDYKYLYFCFNLVNEVPSFSEDNVDKNDTKEIFKTTNENKNDFEDENKNNKLLEENNNE